MLATLHLLERLEHFEVLTALLLCGQIPSGLQRAFFIGFLQDQPQGSINPCGVL
jgi:hypothetical protein